ncbi:unnamed protein product [Rotaria sordida]|uniref:Uncharacterized protein n=1 Tax=Rotaria sordida TaxID=392033 RepID=A0A814RI64_9BILA|nr:unnamed protein product [Rotaria sordida]CAF0798111.1 unnamed protein product [Rotaria sordida]CAF0979037.1 unnamed protein product [Rotaria sordida]CAF0979940.1 unnamed protein product [Rotaria sordida]CAF1133751.1 unnamed protein product [Rotaria sordida]
MSSCRCCLTPHPLRLIERFNLSIQTIKLIRRNCTIFENILLDEYEHLERISSNLNKYLIDKSIISNQIYSCLSQITSQLNNRSENLIKSLNKFEYLTIKCSIWLKTHSIKSIHSQLKYYKKQFDLFNNFIEQHSYKNNLTKKFQNNFSIFQTNYQQQCLQMDSIEYEHIKLFLESIQLFSSIISIENNNNNNKINSIININQNINEWKEKNKFHITWLPDEHQQNEKNIHLLKLDNDDKHIEQSSSDIEIKAIDNCSNHSQDKYAYESNLSWSFTIANKQEDLSMSSSIHQLIENSKPSQSTINTTKSSSINRVRLAIEAIERNAQHFPRERKS